MRIQFKNIVKGVFFLLLGACAKDDSTTDTEKSEGESTSIHKIMSLGASRVEGGRPNYESYRYELWKDLKENNRTFDFVGTQSDDASYPILDGVAFDTDHEGRGGWTSGELLEGLPSWLNEVGEIDIVLFSSPGGNDALQGMSYIKAVANVNEIIDLLQDHNPNITIVMEQMAPAKSDAMTPFLTSSFEKMQKEVLNMAASKTTTTSLVTTVDMFTGFKDSYLADDVHYNQQGAEFIAQRYFDALVEVME